MARQSEDLEEARRRKAAELVSELGTRARLLVYIASAPGAGKTRRLIEDARRLRAAGKNVAIGWLDVKGRSDVEQLARGLVRVPPRIVRLEEETPANAPSFDFAQKADAQMITDEEASSSDVNKLKRVTERLKLLIDLSQSMGASLEPRKLLKSSLDKIFEVFPQADRGMVLLCEKDRLVVRAQRTRRAILQVYLL